MISYAINEDVVLPNFRFDMTQMQNKSMFEKLPDDMVIFYGKGRKDNFCVYIGKSVWDEAAHTYKAVCSTVSDTYYFAMVKYLADTYGFDMIYRHHLSAIYNYTTRAWSKDIVNKIREMVKKNMQPEDVDTAVMAYLLVYYGMVAEENDMSYGNNMPPCGKLIKMYGLYCYLQYDIPLLAKNGQPGACNCLQGKSPQTILQNAQAVGIFRTSVITLF